jgi:hypothetical protein
MTRRAWRLARVAFASGCLLLCGARPYGAEIFYLDHDEFTHQYTGPVGPLVVSGEIVAGETKHVLQKIFADPERFLEQNTVVLAGHDGEVAEAIKLAKLLQSLHSRVRVGELTGTCSGACFLVYAAADERVTDASHLLGIRRFDEVEAANPDVRDFIRNSAIPPQLLEPMLHGSAGSVYWLSARDEADLGLRSAAFIRYLTGRCGWDVKLERAALSGRRPMSDLEPLLACRRRVALADARRVLADARESGARKALLPTQH